MKKRRNRAIKRAGKHLNKKRRRKKGNKTIGEVAEILGITMEDIEEARKRITID